MKSDSLDLLIKLAERRERLSQMAVVAKRRAMEEAAQLRAQAQMRMEQASFKAENERFRQAKVGMTEPVSARRLRDGHEYGYILLWKALAEFHEVRKADTALAERRSDLAQATQAYKAVVRRRQKLELMRNTLIQKESIAAAMSEFE